MTTTDTEATTLLKIDAPLAAQIVAERERRASILEDHRQFSGPPDHLRPLAVFKERECGVLPLLDFSVHRNGSYLLAPSGAECRSTGMGIPELVLPPANLRERLHRQQRYFVELVKRLESERRLWYEIYRQAQSYPLSLPPPRWNVELCGPQPMPPSFMANIGAITERLAYARSRLWRIEAQLNPAMPPVYEPSVEVSI